METLICDACDKPTPNPIQGYLASGTITCRPCYDYMENEVFAYKPERDGPASSKTLAVEPAGFWDKYDEWLQKDAGAV